MIREATMNAAELVPNSVSPVPSMADWTELRGVCRVLLHQPSPLLFAFPRQEFCHISIKPMGKTPVEYAGKLSPCLMFDSLEVFNAKHLDVREVHFFQGFANHGLDFSVGMLLPFGELLDSGIEFQAHILLVGEIEAVLVVGIHADDCAFLLQNWSGLLHDEVDIEFIVFLAQPDGLGHVPAIGKIFIDHLRGFHGNNHFRGSRPDELHSVVESSVEGFNFDKVIIQSYNMLMQFWLCPIKLGCGAHCFLGLLGKCLGETSCNMKLVCAFVDSLKVCELGTEILPLPEEVYEILSSIMAKMKEFNKSLCLARIQVVEGDSSCSPHRFWMLMSFNHTLEFYHN